MSYNSLPYILLFIFLTLLFLIELRNKNNYTIRNRIRLVVFSVFFVFFGFRGYVGSDWFNYKISYELTSWDDWLTIDYEPGFAALVKTLKLIGLDYFYVVTVITAIQLILFDRLVNRYFDSNVLPYIILISLFPIVVIDLQRNFISILIVMNALSYLEKGRKLNFYLAIILAISFHLSAIVFIILPWLKRVRFKKLTLILLFNIGFIVYFAQFNFYQGILSWISASIGGPFEELIIQAIRDEEEAYGLSIGIIEKIFIAYLLIGNYNKLSNVNPLLLNLCVIYLCVYFYFSTSQSFINRFANLFMFGYIWYYTIVFKYYSKQIGFSLIAIFMFLFLVIRTYLAYQPSLYYYKNILFEEEIYLERKYLREQHYDK